MTRIACAVVFAAALPVVAQTYPAKPIRVIVPFPPGGGIDTVARLITPKLSEALGQTIIVDNRAGAAGTLGTELVAKAPPDGYTVLATFASHAQNATLFRNLNFDTVKDFAPITLIGTVPNLLVVNRALPARNVRELVALAKKRPGEILYASVGPGTPAHLSAELFNAMAGIKMTHIAYKGAAASMVALISGESQVTFTTVLVAVPHVASGKLRALGVAALKRSSAMPNVPTIDEAGVKGYDSTAWYGLLAPAHTPAAIVTRWRNETLGVINRPELKERFAQLGAEPVGSTPDEFDRVIRDDITKWGKVVRALGVTAD
jgi:tripartite-type tricarboxylate transporter receptor subunit TctC